MKKIIRKIYLATMSTIAGFATIGCGIKYCRLSYDISKWDVSTLFSNSALINTISSDNKIRQLLNSNFYRDCFVNKNKKSFANLTLIHQKLPFVYFLIHDNCKDNFTFDVYTKMLPIIKHAIINYEAKTKIASNSGLSSLKIINQTIDIKHHINDNEQQQIYLKIPKNDGLLYQKDIYHLADADKIPKHATLLTKFIDSSEQTKSISVSSLLNFLIEPTDGKLKNKYYNLLTNLKYVITISWF